MRQSLTFFLLTLALLGLGDTAFAAQSIHKLEQDCIKQDRPVSCAKAGVHYEKAGNKTKAIKYYKKACHVFIQPIGTACYLYGMLIGNKAKAKAAFEKACRLKDADGCTAAGEASAKAGQIANALSYFKRGCESNDGRGCHRMARWLFKRQKATQAMNYLRRSCALGYPPGCGYLGWNYQNKYKNIAKAQKAYKVGCKLKGSVECARLGLLLYKLKKPRKALRYLRRSCRFGYSRGCKLARKLNLQQKGRR